MARIKHYQKYTHSVLNIYDWGGFFADFRIVKVFYLVSFASKTPITGWTIVDCSIEVRTVLGIAVGRILAWICKNFLTFRTCNVF